MIDLEHINKKKIHNTMCSSRACNFVEIASSDVTLNMTAVKVIDFTCLIEIKQDGIYTKLKCILETH